MGFIFDGVYIHENILVDDDEIIEVVEADDDFEDDEFDYFEE